MPKNPLLIVGTIALLVLVLAIIPFVSSFFIVSIGASSGTQTGIVTALEYNHGLFFSSRLAYVKTDARSSQEDVYCINDPDLFMSLKSYQQNQTRITFEYRNSYVLWRWECDGGESIIRSVVVTP